MRKNIFDLKVSVFKNKEAKKPMATKTFRELYIDNAMQPSNDIEKSQLPGCTPSGICLGGHTDDNIQHNGVVCIDIDEKQNTHIEDFADLKKYICRIPWVAYCGHSAGGIGYLLFVSIVYPDKHREHYQAIIEDLRKVNIIADTSCINPGRFRFLRPDMQPYVNESAEVYTRLVEKKPVNIRTEDIDISDAVNIGICVSLIRSKNINIAESNEDWFSVGCSLAVSLGEQGRKFFHLVSSISDKYEESENDKLYDRCLRDAKKSNEGAFFNHCKKHGIYYNNI